MTIDGVWAVLYWGEDFGLGILIVKDGQIHGTDIAGTKYNGTVTADPASGNLHLEIEMTVPAGVGLVGGAGSMDLPHTRKFNLDLPPRFGELTPVNISGLPGKTTAVFKQVPDTYAPYANGFTVAPRSG